MRCGILGFLQESNTFVASRTTLADFEADILLTGEAVRAQFAGAPHEIGGFFAGLEQEAAEAVPLFAARALPGGTIESGAFEQIMNMMAESICRAGPIDGLLVAPHGATVSENVGDVDGYWLAQAREHFGPQMRIVGTLDPHANLSEAMVSACDALIAYRTNPHVDQRQRGEEAARLLARTVRGEVQPVMAAAFPPSAIGIARQETAEPPCAALCAQADEFRRVPGILSVSIVLGFPYADVPEMGSSVMAIADGDKSLASRIANQLADAMWHDRHTLNDLQAGHTGVDAAIDGALAAKPPVCLLDMGDNVGGGSPGDGMWLAGALHQRCVPNALVVICDPKAVEMAAAAGCGSRLAISIGGCSGLSSGSPLQGSFKVQGLYDGRFRESGATHGGFTDFNQGPSAVFSNDHGLCILATSRRMVPFSLAQLTSCGLDPGKFRIIVAKGVNAPIAAYSKVCRTFIRVDTPGPTTADMTRLNYSRRRRPMFPFERDFQWSAASGKQVSEQ
jgi:microcystin degradation protein MlrC